jgi:hypothetical protein
VARREAAGVTVPPVRIKGTANDDGVVALQAAYVRRGIRATSIPSVLSSSPMIRAIPSVPPRLDPNVTSTCMSVLPADQRPRVRFFVDDADRLDRCFDFLQAVFTTHAVCAHEGTLICPKASHLGANAPSHDVV